MKSAAFTLRRLLESLEELGRREDGALAGGDGLAFLALEQRAEPLVRKVTELASDALALEPSLLARGRALIATRSERRQRLMRLLETTRDEISRLDEARSRVRAIRPAYVSPAIRVTDTPGFAACG